MADGVSVWFAGTQGWAEQVDQACAYDEAGFEAGLALATSADAAQRVVEIHAIEVTREEGEIFPVAHREQIRARGPSVRADLPAGVWRDGAAARCRRRLRHLQSPYAGLSLRRV